MPQTVAQQTQTTPIQRWRTPLLIGVLAGWLSTVLSGSTLLFFLLAPTTRAWWALVHWTVAFLTLAPYAIYQLRHYERVRALARQTHHRAGLHALWLVLGAITSGLLLIAPLSPGSGTYLAVDLAHLFFGFAFTLVLSAHRTLVAMPTLARAGAERRRTASRAIAVTLAVATMLSVAALIAAAVYSR